MKVKILIFVLVAGGLIVGKQGISLRKYYDSFIPTEGVVGRFDGDKKPIIKFQDNIKTENVRSEGHSEFVFPLNEHTRNLKVGDKVTVHHSPGHLNGEEARFDKDISYALPYGLISAGFVLFLAAAVVYFVFQPAKAKPEAPSSAPPNPLS
jgi:hypothetical protein